jgi:hypothetical protein
MMQGSGMSLPVGLRAAAFAEDNDIVFRVASAIPEPSTLLLFCSGSLAVLWRRRR